MPRSDASGTGGDSIFLPRSRRGLIWAVGAIGSSPAEGVARADVARFHAAAKPFRSLPRASMGERIGNDMAGGHLLQAIVADGRYRIHARGDIGLVDDAALARRMAPDARQTIRLQFHPHREWVGCGGIGAAQPAHLGFDAEQFLHVMTELVRDHVGLAEFARRAEAIGKLVEEA